MDWQQIETAPKDGTEILLGCFGFVMSVRFSFVTNSYWLPRCIGSPLLEDPNGKCVCCPDDPAYTGEWKNWEHYCAYPPTHWMPLPEPSLRGEKTSRAAHIAEARRLLAKQSE